MPEEQKPEEEQKKPEEDKKPSEKKQKPKHPPGVGSWTGFDYYDQE